MINKILPVSALLAVIMFSSVAYSFDGGHNREHGSPPSHPGVLDQLPEEKQFLFEQTMQEVQEKTASVRRNMGYLGQEIKQLIASPEFNESLFLEKTRELYELRSEIYKVMNEAIVRLSKQFTPQEREVLVELLPQHMGNYRPAER